VTICIFAVLQNAGKVIVCCFAKLYTTERGHMLSKQRFIIFMLFASVTTLMHAQNSVPTVTIKTRRTWPEIFEDVQQAAVQIHCFGRSANWREPYNPGKLCGGSGSGFFVNESGRVIIYTNFHVVDGAETIIIQHPHLFKEQFEVELEAGAPPYDIAFLRFKAGEEDRLKKMLKIEQLATVTLGDSDRMKVGQEVGIIGYPLGQEEIKQSLGFVSGHEALPMGEYMSVSAPAFPGNSGGACLNNEGQVIGILSAGAVSEKTGMTETLGYVMPINVAKVLAQDSLANSTSNVILNQVMIGIDFASTTQSTFQYLATTQETGYLVNFVVPRSLADNAGLRVHDVIHAINDYPVSRFGYVTVPWTSYPVRFIDVLNRINLGQPITFTLSRQGQAFTITTVKELHNIFQIKRYYPPFDAMPAYHAFGGMVVMELTLNYLDLIAKYGRQVSQLGTHSNIFKMLSLDSWYEPRVLITHLFPDSEFFRNDLFNPMDCIIETVNEQPVRTLVDYEQALQLSKTTGMVVIKTIDNTIAALPLALIMAQEPSMQAKYGYPLSSLYEQLQ
jgi:S1-C subfamily serine protease